MDLKKIIPLYIGAAVGPLGGFGVVAIVPVFAGVWSIDFAAASLAITFYMIPFIAIQIFSGPIAQLFDVRRTLLAGFGIYTLGGILCALSGSFSFFLIGRIVQGTGGAFLTPILMAMVGEVVPARHLGKAMGGLGLAYTAGVTLGPAISGLIEVRCGWQGFFYFLSALSAITSLYFMIWCKDVCPQTEGGHSLFGIFPLIRRAISLPGVVSLSLAAFSLFVAYIGIMTFTADYLKTTFALPSDRIGLLLSLTGLSGLIMSPIAGVLGDRYGRHMVFAGGTIIMLAALGLMLSLPFHYGHDMALFLLLGAGSATAWTSLNTMAVQASPELRTPVTSIYNALKFSGYALSPVILSIFYGDNRLTTVQLACGGAIIVSLLLALRARQTLR
ncbi:MAG: MFS transporter [Deltaproteobacteria bacterium]|nr:MFS transporter [Deltaproteobacteria bacterium]